MGRNTGPKNVGGFLPSSLLRQLGERLDEAARLRALWQRHAPAPLAGHIHPVNFTQGSLLVYADSPAWASRLRQQQARLVTVLRQERDLARLEVIHVRVRPSSAPAAGSAAAASGGSEPAARRATRLSPLAADLARDLAQDIKDPQLRRALERLYEHAAAGGRRQK